MIVSYQYYHVPPDVSSFDYHERRRRSMHCIHGSRRCFESSSPMHATCTGVPRRAGAKKPAALRETRTACRLLSSGSEVVDHIRCATEPLASSHASSHIKSERVARVVRRGHVWTHRAQNSTARLLAEEKSS